MSDQQEPESERRKWEEGRKEGDGGRGMNEEGSTVSPQNGFDILESARPKIIEAFKGQGDSPASAVNMASVGYENALAELDRLRQRIQEVEQGWISVEERLPKEAEGVLLSYYWMGRGPIVTCGYLAYTSDLGWIFNVESLGPVEPNYWRPLPAAPNPQETHDAPND